MKKKQSSLILFSLLSALECFCQPIPDCGNTFHHRHLFVSTNGNLISSLIQYNATPSQLEANATTCFVIFDRSIKGDNGKYSINFKLYPANTTWPPEDYPKSDNVMEFQINLNNKPDSFNYYLKIDKFKKGKYFIYPDKNKPQEFTIVKCYASKETEVKALNITPRKLKRKPKKK